jgi:hypothetical protein
MVKETNAVYDSKHTRFCSKSKYWIWIDVTTGYFTLLIHMSQYLSIRVTLPSTLNRASWVAMLPQCAQNFGFPPDSTKGFIFVNIFFVFPSPKIHRSSLLGLYSYPSSRINCTWHNTEGVYDDYHCLYTNSCCSTQLTIAAVANLFPT